MAAPWLALTHLVKSASRSRSWKRRSIGRRRLDGPEMLEVRSLLSTAAAPIVQYGDNSLSGFSTSGGQWVASTGGGYLGNQAVSNPASGAGDATWTFNVTPGTYLVAATWPAAGNQATNAIYQVSDGPTLRSTVTVDQRISVADFADSGSGSSGARWESLGGPVAVKGSELVVQLSNQANGPVVADGVRIQRVSSLVYQPQGPYSVAQFSNLQGQQNPGLPYLGAVQAAVPNPSNPQQMWIATVNGGIWRTNDALDASPTWVPETDQAGSLSMADLQLDPTDPTNQTLVAAVGRVSNFGSAGGALTGLMRTTDGGTTWTPLGQAAGGNGTVSLQGLTIRSVAARGNLIFAAAVSTDTAPYGQRNGGLFVSDDTGKTFRPVQGLDNATSAYMIAGVPGALGPNDPNSQTWFVSTNQGLFKSVDNGQDWSPANGSGGGQLVLPSNMTSLKFAVSTPAPGQTPVLYAVVVAAENVDEIYRSDDLGASWARLNLPLKTSDSQADINLAIVVSPQDANLFYMSLSQVRVFRGEYTGATSAPVTWTTIGEEGSNTSGPNADSRSLAFDQQGNLIEVDDGGIYKRTNPAGDGEWSSLIGNLQVTEIHSVAFDPATQTILDGVQDNGDPGSLTSANTTWADQNIAGADGGQVQITPDGLRYTSSQKFGDFAKRRRGGKATQPKLELFLPDGRKSGMTLDQFVAKHEGSLPFVTPFRVDAVAANRFVVGGKFLYESTDQGKMVRLISRRSFGETTTLAYGGMVIDPKDPGGLRKVPGLLYVGTDRPQSYLVVRTCLDRPLHVVRTYPGSTPRQIVIDPRNGLVAFVVDSSNRVWMTRNAGKTAAGWTDLTGNLTDPQLRTLAVVTNPRAKGQFALLAGGQGGIYRMLGNAPGRWGMLGAGLPDALVYDMQYTDVKHSDILLAGTLGRGNWTIGNLAANPAAFAPMPTVSPIAAQGVITGTSSGAIGFTVGGGSVPAADLVVTATSSNPNLIPNADIMIGGAGANRTIAFTPAAGTSGHGSITVTVSDGTSSSFRMFGVVVGATAPGLSLLPIANQTIDENTTTQGIPFAIAHAANPGDVTFAVKSSNPTLIPADSILIDSQARTLTITPARNQSGTADITLIAQEGETTVTTQFVVTVIPIANQPPEIAPIRNQVRDVGASPIRVPLTVKYQPGTIPLGYIPDESDSVLQVPFGNLILEVQSSNPALIPLRDAEGAPQITIRRTVNSPSSFTLEATPTPDGTGTSTITVSANNGESSVNRTFRIQIRPQNAAAAVPQVGVRREFASGG